MTALTGRRTYGKRAERLKSLAESCDEFVANGSRRPDAIDAALDVLQCLKDGEPFLITRLEDISMTRATLCDIFSRPITHTPLDPSTRAYCTQRGIAYVGELFLIEWDKRSRTRLAIEKLLTSWTKLPTFFNPIKMGWRPPYANYETCHATWSLPVEAIVDGPEATRLHFAGVHYVGQYIAQIEKTPEGLFRAQQRMPRFRGFQTRAGMYVVRWEAPPPPPEWSEAAIAE